MLPTDHIWPSLAIGAAPYSRHRKGLDPWRLIDASGAEHIVLRAGYHTVTLRSQGMSVVDAPVNLSFLVDGLAGLPGSARLLRLTRSLLAPTLHAKLEGTGPAPWHDRCPAGEHGHRGEQAIGAPADGRDVCRGGWVGERSIAPSPAQPPPPCEPGTRARRSRRCPAASCRIVRGLRRAGTRHCGAGTPRPSRSWALKSDDDRWDLVGNRQQWLEASRSIHGVWRGTMGRERRRGGVIVTGYRVDWMTAARNEKAVASGKVEKARCSTHAVAQWVGFP
jgi:hypothetical protein